MPHVDVDAASSRLSRLAMISGTNAAQFFADQGIRFADIVDGKPIALQQLARRARVKPRALKSGVVAQLTLEA
jgi:hypothetical protein